MGTLREAVEQLVRFDPDAYIGISLNFKAHELLSALDSNSRDSKLDWSQFDGNGFFFHQVIPVGNMISETHPTDASATPVFVTPAFAKSTVNWIRSEAPPMVVNRGGRPPLFSQVFKYTKAKSLELSTLEVFVDADLDNPQMTEFFMTCKHLDYRVRWDAVKRDVLMIDKRRNKVVHGYNTVNNSPETLGKRLVEEIHRDMLLSSPTTYDLDFQ